MKSIDERVNELFSDLPFNANSDGSHPYKAKLRLALLETARDQRHACAEAVNDLNVESYILDRAHQIVMNADIK